MGNETNNRDGPGHDGNPEPIRDIDAEELPGFKYRFWTWVASLAVAVFGYRYVMEVIYTYNRYWEGYVAAALGGTVTIVAITGILPLLWFAIGRRWNYREHLGPMILWSVFAVAFCWMNYQGESYLRQ